MKHFIIDGNNLIGRTKILNQRLKKDKQSGRERLAFILSRYFSRRKAIVSLHFDGFENEKINVSEINIKYSQSLSADEKIKREIESVKNPRNIILITSDLNLLEFGRVCSCQILKSEEFANLILSSDTSDEEKSKIEEINSTDEFRRLFGIK